MLSLPHPVCLGTQHLGASLSDEAAAHDLLDAYVARGGALLDTAPDFGAGRAQHIVGRWLKRRAGALPALSTKFGFGATHRTDQTALADALRASLDALGVEQVALLWCQGWDGHTPLDALLDALCAAVADGLARHIALTDWPAWAAARLISLAHARQLPAPIALQLEYGPLSRQTEHDQLALARHLGLTPLAWGITCGGAITHGQPTGYYQHLDSPAWRAAQRAFVEAALALHMPPERLATSWIVARGCVATIGPASPAHLDALWPAPLDPGALARVDAICPPQLPFPQRYWASLYRA